MMRRIHEAVAEFLFPTRAVCLGCGDPSGQDEEWLCPRCRAKVRTGVHAVQSGEWPADGVSRAWFALYYEDPIARLIRHYKYNGVYRLAPFFIECMKPLLAALAAQSYDCLVPVPLHKKRFIQRGFNQAEVLAWLISKETGIRLENALRRTRNTHKQSRLSISGRRGNVLGAFEATMSLSGLRVLLVDDVFTTGSTANSCAKALRAAGACDVQALTVAASRHYRIRKAAVYRKKEATITTKP